MAHLNDGRYGNGHSWIAASAEGEWAQIELPQPAAVARVGFSGFGEGTFNDRVPVAVEVQLSADCKAWRSVAKVTASNLAGHVPAPSAKPLPEPASVENLVRYAFLCERETWQRMNAPDLLSPRQK